MKWHKKQRGYRNTKPEKKRRNNIEQRNIASKKGAVAKRGGGKPENRENERFWFFARTMFIEKR